MQLQPGMPHPQVHHMQACMVLWNKPDRPISCVGAIECRCSDAALRAQQGRMCAWDKAPHACCIYCGMLQRVHGAPPHHGMRARTARHHGMHACPTVPASRHRFKAWPTGPSGAAGALRSATRQAPGEHPTTWPGQGLHPTDRGAGALRDSRMRRDTRVAPSA